MGNMLESLFGNAIQGRVIVEAEVTSVNDMVGSGLFREVVERS